MNDKTSFEREVEEEIRREEFESVAARTAQFAKAFAPFASEAKSTAKNITMRITGGLTVFGLLVNLILGLVLWAFSAPIWVFVVLMFLPLAFTFFFASKFVVALAL